MELNEIIKYLENKLKRIEDICNLSFEFLDIDGCLTLEEILEIIKENKNI